MRKLTGRQQETTVADGVSTESLNDHYAAISTDHSYSTPSLKPIANSAEPEYMCLNIPSGMCLKYSTICALLPPDLMAFPPGSSSLELHSSVVLSPTYSTFPLTLPLSHISGNKLVKSDLSDVTCDGCKPLTTTVDERLFLID